MRVAIMQPYFFPYLGYFQLISAVDTFVVFDDVNFIKKGWINRNKILVNGKEHMFTLPIVNVSQNSLINELNIVSGDKWKNKLFKTIKMSYKKAPFYNDSIDLVNEILFSSSIQLSEFIYNSIRTICVFFDINTHIIPTSSGFNSHDLQGEDKILKICSSLRASEYINPIGGKALYSKLKFIERGISLLFLNTHLKKYNQFNMEFVPSLSIVDVMMFNSKKDVVNMLTDFELEENE